MPDRQSPDAWKSRSSVDYGTKARSRRMCNLIRWSNGRRSALKLAAIRAISDVDVLGLARNASGNRSRLFRPHRALRDTMAQQNLDLSNGPAGYTLQIRGSTADSSP